MPFVSVQVVHSYNSMNTANAWKKSRFILLDRPDLYMINNLLIAVLAFARKILTSLSVDEMMLLIYKNCSTGFKGQPLKVKMVFLIQATWAQFYLPLSGDQCLLLLAQVYVIWIRIRLVYLQYRLLRYSFFKISSASYFFEWKAVFFH